MHICSIQNFQDSIEIKPKSHKTKILPIKSIIFAVASDLYDITPVRYTFESMDFIFLSTLSSCDFISIVVSYTYSVRLDFMDSINLLWNQNKFKKSVIWKCHISLSFFPYDDENETKHTRTQNIFMLNVWRFKHKRTVSITFWHSILCWYHSEDLWSAIKWKI